MKLIQETIKKSEKDLYNKFFNEMNDIKQKTMMKSLIKKF
jgi:hypothetical protein